MLREIHIPSAVNEHCLPGLETVKTTLPDDIRKQILTLDGDLFYPETFTEKRISEDFPDVPLKVLQEGATELGFTEADLLYLEPTYVRQKIEGARGRLQALLHALSTEDPTQPIPPPSKYYAALMMDGDHMGRFLSQVTEPQAQGLSQRLSDFACTKAKSAVESHLGRLVYAGGDDALALLPLEEVLPCARELRHAFHAAIKDSPRPEGVSLPTISIGIAIAHYLDPLDSVLTAMQQAEKSAKENYGRDAICVHVLKRSGEEVRVGTHWSYGDVDAVEIVEKAVAAFRDDTLTMKFAYALADEARSLESTKLPWEARAAEFKRLARRHSALGEDQKKDAEGLATELAKWAEGPGTGEVAKWVLLARFIAAGGRDEE
jgi:CRISPR-associated protein Cmr2